MGFYDAKAARPMVIEVPPAGMKFPEPQPAG
jgi:hypothetical protein